jgi:hypothetical protein
MEELNESNEEIKCIIQRVPRMTQSSFPGVHKKLLTATGSAFTRLTV